MFDACNKLLLTYLLTYLFSACTFQILESPFCKMCKMFFQFFYMQLPRPILSMWYNDLLAS